MIKRLFLLTALGLASVIAHAGDQLVLAVTEAGEMGRPDLAALKADLPRRVAQGDMTVQTQVAVVRRTSGGVSAIGAFDGACSLVDAQRFRDGTAERTANAATRELMNSAAALVRVADQQRFAPGYVALCVVADRTIDFQGLLKLPAQGFVVQAVGGMVYLVQQVGGVLMFTI
jgi:hypothetical protein